MLRLALNGEGIVYVVKLRYIYMVYYRQQITLKKLVLIVKFTPYKLNKTYNLLNQQKIIT